MKVNKKLPLSLAAPAQRALASAGIATLGQLSKITEVKLLTLHGMGPNALKQTKLNLKQAGLKLKS